MIASMMRATAVLLIVAGGLYGATAANEALLCGQEPSHLPPDEAIRHCTAAIQSGGLPSADLAVALVSRCRAYIRKPDYARALPDCERAIQLAPKAAMPVNMRGWVRFNSGNLDGALLDFEQAISLDPNLAMAYRGRARVHIRQKQYDQAIRDYTEAARLDPDGTTYVGRGECYFHKRDYDSAKADFNEAIRWGAGARAYWDRGWCYIRQVDYSRAMVDFDQAIRLEPKFAAAYRARAWVHNRRREYDEAIRDYDQALRLSADARGYYARGRAYYHKGAYILALRDFVQASWRFWTPLVVVVGLLYVLSRRRKDNSAESPAEASDEPPAPDDLEPLVESPDAPAEEPVPDPEPLQADTDLDALIRTGMKDRTAIALLEGLLQQAGIPFFVMDQNTVARQEGGNFVGWWDIRVPHEREAEAREIIRAVEGMK